MLKEVGHLWSVKMQANKSFTVYHKRLVLLNFGLVDIPASFEVAYLNKSLVNFCEVL